MAITDNMQANTQHAVPQNIMDVEFKLIGDLTMRQFFYLMIFSGIAYAAFTLKIPLILRWPTIIGSILLGLGFAFIPVEDRGFDEWIVNFFRAVYQDNQRIWKKEPTPPSAFLHENISIVKQELITLAPTSSRRKLEQYLTYQQKATKIDPLDIPEQAYIDKIHNAYIDYKPTRTAVALDEPMVTVEPFLQPSGPQFEGQELPDKEKEEKAEAPKQKPIDEVSTFKPIQVIQKRPKRIEPIRVPTDAQNGASLSPITPDRHSGRKFTNLLGNDGNIVLPIRGEKILSLEGSIENENIDRDTEQKAERLKQYIAQIKQTEKNFSATSRNETQIETETPKEKATPLPDGTYSEDIKKQMGDMAKPVDKSVGEEVQDPTINASNVKSEEVPVPTVPNILSGKVKDKEGKGIQNILLIIKNAHNDPVRAIKTNALGHFTISNPLPNGPYKINVDVNKETGLTFDIIDVEASGGIIQPMEFIGK